MIDDNGDRISTVRFTPTEVWIMTTGLLILATIFFYVTFVDNDAKVRHVPPSETMQVANGN